MHRLLFALLVGLTPALAPVPAGADGRVPAVKRGLKTVYDLYLGGVLAGELKIHAVATGARYRARSAMRTTGLIGLVYKASFEAEILGRLSSRGLVPELFRAASRMRKKRQFVKMAYGAAAPARIEARPPFRPKPWQIEPTRQAGTLDPISAALLALAPRPRGEICRQTVEVFDGRRRYAVDIGAPVRAAKRIRCPAVYRRIAGFKPKLMKKKPKFPFDVWLEERADGLTHVVLVTGETMFGLAVVRLRR